MTLKPGWYLVGRRDGSVEPKLFYGQLEGQRLATIDGHGEDFWFDPGAYWWERQEIPDTIYEALGITEEKG